MGITGRRVASGASALLPTRRRIVAQDVKRASPPALLALGSTARKNSPPDCFSFTNPSRLSRLLAQIVGGGDKKGFPESFFCKSMQICRRIAPAAGLCLTDWIAMTDPGTRTQNRLVCPSPLVDHCLDLRGAHVCGDIPRHGKALLKKGLVRALTGGK